MEKNGERARAEDASTATNKYRQVNAAQKRSIAEQNGTEQTAQAEQSKTRNSDKTESEFCKAEQTKRSHAKVQAARMEPATRTNKSSASEQKCRAIRFCTKPMAAHQQHGASFASNSSQANRPFCYRWRHCGHGSAAAVAAAPEATAAAGSVPEHQHPSVTLKAQPPPS